MLKGPSSLASLLVKGEVKIYDEGVLESPASQSEGDVEPTGEELPAGHGSQLNGPVPDLKVPALHSVQL